MILMRIKFFPYFRYNSSFPFVFQKEISEMNSFVITSISKGINEMDTLHDKSVIGLKVQDSDEFIDFNEAKRTLKTLFKAQPILISKFGPSESSRDPSKIYAGDILRILHNETEAFIEAGLENDTWVKISDNFNDDNEMDLGKIHDLMEENLIKGKFRVMLPEIVSSKAFDQSYGSKNLFVIEKSNVFDGGQISEKDEFLLRNLVSDGFLTFEYKSRNDCVINLKPREKFPHKNQMLNANSLGQNLLYNKNLILIKKGTKDKVDYLKVKEIKQNDQFSAYSIEIAEANKEMFLNFKDQLTFILFTDSEILEFLYLKDFRELVSMLIPLAIKIFRKGNPTKNDFIRFKNFSLMCKRMATYLVIDENNSCLSTKISSSNKRISLFFDQYLLYYILVLNSIFWKKSIEKK